MAGGHEVGAVFLRNPEEGVELDLPVAEHVRVRSPAAGIFIEHVVHDPLPVFLREIDEIEGNADFPGHHLGHEAVFLPLAVAVEGRVGFMPVLHEHGEDVVALLFEEQRRDARVHPAGQPDTDLFPLPVFHFVQFLRANVTINRKNSYIALL